jgi:hypothetical protein
MPAEIDCGCVFHLLSPRPVHALPAACGVLPLSVAVASLIVAAAVGLGAQLAASGLLIGGATSIDGRLCGAQLSHADSSVSESGIT